MTPIIIYLLAIFTSLYLASQTFRRKEFKLCLTTLISDVTVDCLFLTAGGTSAQFSQTGIMLEGSPLEQQITCSAQYSNLSELQ